MARLGSVKDELRNENGELRRQLAVLQRRQDAASELEIYRASFEKAAAGLVRQVIETQAFDIL